MDDPFSPDAWEARRLAEITRRQQLLDAGQFYEACLDFCHEGLSVTDITDDEVHFGLCSADVSLPLSLLPASLQPVDGDTSNLYRMDDVDWPAVMKNAMRPIAEHCLAILRQGGDGC